MRVEEREKGREVGFWVLQEEISLCFKPRSARTAREFQRVEENIITF